MAELVSWQQLYRDAMLVLDAARLTSSIEAAWAAIGDAMDEPGTDRKLEDKQVIIEALHNLQTPERLELQRPARPDSVLLTSTEE